jgi:hypothetical protein
VNGLSGQLIFDENIKRLWVVRRYGSVTGVGRPVPVRSCCWWLLCLCCRSMNSTASNNREMAGALAVGLGGRSFIIRHHNQPDGWQSSRGGGSELKRR